MHYASHETDADSVLEDFLQKIGKRGPPDKHAMGSWHDRINMLDVQHS